MFLGLDIGTSAVKGLVWDGARVLGAASAPLKVQVPVPGASEQDPEAWWHGILAVCAELSAQPGWAEVSAIGLSGQMHGAVCLGPDGAVLRPAILWNDNRAVREAAEMAALPGLAARVGVPPMPGFPAPKLAWLARAEPELHAATTMVMQAKDWVGMRLHGRAVTEYSEAAGTLWLDQAARDWDREALAFSGLERAQMPALGAGTDLAGPLSAAAAAALGLKPGVPVIRGGGDAMVGAAGIGVVAPGQAMISLGTSGQYLVASEAHRPNPAGLVHSFAHCVPGAYIQMAAMLNGAAPMAWLAGVLGRSVPDLLAAAEMADPAHVPLFLPYLTGERTPHGDPKARAGFEGLSHGSGPGEMMRAVVDAIAYSFADAQAVLGEAGVRAASPLAIGGGARSDLVLQTLADVLELPVQRPASADLGPALGAAKLAAVGSGAMPAARLADPPEIGAVFQPRPSARHGARLARYRALYSALRGVCGRP
ncbi:xylulokinase [Dinoroseobacter sp. PD6]|uniref:xylulokinase n=1 Tax=Dinoroseobacter sp. PD6 TaxID=3028384 RepID=UPI00237B75BD|nr:xylulokinase [Dinoroseobacter sp. PD6]MDD9716078.1 xylulokinase [Dinoroseobacter sp. PD6]